MALRTHRLAGEDAFAEVHKHGRRASKSGVMLVLAPGPFQIGFAVGAKAGSAVDRNRFRRVVREYFRLHPIQGRVIISARGPLSKLSNSDIRRIATELIAQCTSSSRP